MTIDFDAFLAWLIQNWIWPAAIVGVIVLLVIVVSLLPDAKISTSSEFPTTGDEARGLALGAIQLTTSFGDWNDPEARNLAKSKSQRSGLQSTWGLYDRASWLDTIAELPDRRAEPVRDALLALRARLADQLGRRPTKREWVAAAKAEGASDRRVKTVIDNIVNLETGLRAKKLGTRVLPDSATIRTVRGYSYGQAVAVATWGVALGLGTREEARELITGVNELARAEFDSWEEFGRSYLLGRMLRLVEQGQEPAKAIEANSDGILAYGRAFDSRGNGGPWRSLQW